MMVEKVPDSTYEMVGGLDQQIKEIKEVIELPVKHPELFDALGIAQPKGVLLYGPPGTGKTLLARAVAHHTDCSFIRVSGSELVQKYIGEGSRMVRLSFPSCRTLRWPLTVCVGRRSANSSSWHESTHRPSSSWTKLTRLDPRVASRAAAEVTRRSSAPCSSSSTSSTDSRRRRTSRFVSSVLHHSDWRGSDDDAMDQVIMATNRIDILDSALLRPGRIDRKIEFPPPGYCSSLFFLTPAWLTMLHHSGPRLVSPSSASTPARFALALPPSQHAY